MVDIVRGSSVGRDEVASLLPKEAGLMTSTLALGVVLDVTTERPAAHQRQQNYKKREPNLYCSTYYIIFQFLSVALLLLLHRMPCLGSSYCILVRKTLHARSLVKIIGTSTFNRLTGRKTRFEFRESTGSSQRSFVPLLWHFNTALLSGGRTNTVPKSKHRESNSGMHKVLEMKVMSKENRAVLWVSSKRSSECFRRELAHTQYQIHRT